VTGPSTSSRRRSDATAPRAKTAKPVSETLAGNSPSSAFDHDPTANDLAVDPATIVDTVTEGIFVIDPATLRIMEANRGAAELLGRSREEIEDLPIGELVRPADADRFGTQVSAIVAGHADSATLSLDYVRGDGTTIAVEIVLQPVQLPGGRPVILAIARDIRGRVQTQIRLQRLAEAEHARAAELNAVIRAMGEAVVVCASDGSITLSNPAGEAIFPDIEEHTYADILSQFHDPDGSAPRLGVTGGPVELRTIAPPERWIEIATYPVTRGTAGSAQAPATIVVMRDVTEGRRREAVRETFIGVLSHELRTPVTTIFGGAKLLARETSTLDEETRRGIFRDIHEEAERLQRLVEDVVALNRFGEAVGEVGWEPVLLQRLLPRVVQSEDGRWPGVEFKLEIESGLPTVSADPTYVEQVVRNMVSNAAKYGGIHSTVLVERSWWKRRVATARSWSVSSMTAPASPSRNASDSSSSSTVRPRRPRWRAVRVSGCSSVHDSWRQWVGARGPHRASPAAPSSGSRCPSSTSNASSLRANRASGRSRAATPQRSSWPQRPPRRRSRSRRTQL
jgi:PAS domain S-box-containing protein